MTNHSHNGFRCEELEEEAITRFLATVARTPIGPTVASSFSGIGMGEGGGYVLSCLRHLSLRGLSVSDDGARAIGAWLGLVGWLIDWPFFCSIRRIRSPVFISCSRPHTHYPHYHIHTSHTRSHSRRHGEKGATEARAPAPRFHRRPGRGRLCAGGRAGALYVKGISSCSLYAVGVAIRCTYVKAFHSPH